MSNEIQIFNNAEFGDVRTITKENKPLFCATDIAKVLEYTNPHKAIADHCRYLTKCYVPHPQSPDKKIEMTFIPEGDVYRLIIRSKLPSAERFERWVFDEVIPSIRKHGMYAVDELIANPDLGIAALMALKEERAKRAELETTCAVQVQQIAEMKPKASYYDLILNCKDLVSVTKIAKDYGQSAIWLNDKLHELGVQFKQGDIWLLYQKYANMGYTSTKTHEYLGSDGVNHARVATYWTQKGRLFIYGLLKANGVLPTVERGCAESDECA